MIAAYQRFYEVEDIDEERNRAFFSPLHRPQRRRHPDRRLGRGRAARLRLPLLALGSLSAAETVLMNDLYVDEAARGEGVGRALIEAAAEIARERGAHSLEWSTAPDNADRPAPLRLDRRRAQRPGSSTSCRSTIRERRVRGTQAGRPRDPRRSTPTSSARPTPSSGWTSSRPSWRRGRRRDLTPPNGVMLLGRPRRRGGRHRRRPPPRHRGRRDQEHVRRPGAPRRRPRRSRCFAELEAIARERGCRATRLDTSDYLTPAVALYRAAGYREVPDYNGNPKANLWFERRSNVQD